MVKALLLVLLTISPAQGPEAWRCTNAGLAEVLCDSDGCVAATADSYTPMQVSIVGGRLEVCAYSGCFAGAAAMAGRLEGHVVWTARIVDEAPATLMIEESSGVGLLRWGAFANPVLCRSHRPGAGGAGR
jgi:hypothetical protein